MSNSDLLIKVAEVLEAAASHIDTTEAEKIAAVTAQKQSIINSLASKYAEATGEDIPDDLRSKLANSDGDVVDLMKSILEKQSTQMESLGHASAKDDDDALPSTTKEASEKADERFLNWLTS